MKRVGLGLVIGLLAGCVAAEGDESFIILNNLAPTVDPVTGSVVFSAQREGPFVSSAESSFFFDGVTVGSLFESRVQAVEGRESLRTILIEGANISVRIFPTTFTRDNIRTDDGLEETVEFQILFTSALGPNGGLSVGVYDLIPRAIMADMRAKAGDALFDPNVSTDIEMITTTTAFGDFYGDRIESTSFQFPVLLSNPATCGDLTCDGIFEDLDNCPFDCICGNGTCDTARGETTESCLVDCPAPPA